MNKKSVIGLYAILLLFFASAFAGFEDSTSNFQNSASKVNIKTALTMKHNSYVTIEGNIVKQLSEEKYTFQDATGTITVEIDDDKWQGQSVNKNDKLQLTGEIEKKINTVVLDVDTVKKIK